MISFPLSFPLRWILFLTVKIICIQETKGVYKIPLILELEINRCLLSIRQELKLMILYSFFHCSFCLWATLNSAQHLF